MSDFRPLQNPKKKDFEKVMHETGTVIQAQLNLQRNQSPKPKSLVENR